MEIGTRKLKILSIIIEDYIRTGEPVGSKKVCSELENSVSSATVRNDMAELSGLGLIDQPHTSAGRIPTQAGYRLYVDRLMPRKSLEVSEKLSLDSILEEFSKEPIGFLKESCKLLSDLTGLMAVVTTPADKLAMIRQIELIPTGQRTVLLIMMTSIGIMHSRMCRLDVDLTIDTLLVFKRVLNEQLAGKTLMEITPAFIQNAALTLRDLTIVISPLLMAALKVASDAMEVQTIIGGQENLLAMPDIDFFQAKALFSLISKEENLKNLLTSVDNGTKIFVGRETGRPEFEFLSMAAGKYKFGRIGVGRIGVIGPLRMDYAKIYSDIEYFTSSMGEFFNRTMNEEI